MFRTICLTFISLLLFSSYATADPLTAQEIAAFKIEHLRSSSFDVRMRAFRIIHLKGWKEKYQLETTKAIKAMLRHKNIFQNRTGIQGQNMLMYKDAEIDRLIMRLAKKFDYKKGNQHFYFRQTLVEYLVKKMVLAQKAVRACKSCKAASLACQQAALACQ